MKNSDKTGMRFLFVIVILLFAVVLHKANAEFDGARLVISDGPVMDMGEKFIKQKYSRKMILKNIGTETVSDIEHAGVTLKPPFIFRGGSFPGTGGNCSKKVPLRPGKSCALYISFIPRNEGVFETTLQISYSDGTQSQLAERVIRATGITQGCTRLSKEKAQTKFSFLNAQSETTKTIDQGDFWCVIKQNGYYRSAYLYLPKKRAAKAPLVLVFHGGGETAIGIESQSQFSQLADAEGFIVAYPESALVTSTESKSARWDPKAWRYLKSSSKVNDSDFVRKLIDFLSLKITIDKSRIYATGLSNGGSMAYRTACDLNDSIAAIASVGGGMLAPCTPQSPIPVMHFHGTNDPSWPYQGGASCFSNDVFPNALGSLVAWQQYNRCPASSQPRVSIQQGPMVCYTRPSCADATEVTLCTIEGAGAVWPGGLEMALSKKIPWDSTCAMGQGVGSGGAATGISATPLMWQFFKRFSKNTTPTN